MMDKRILTQEKMEQYFFAIVSRKKPKGRVTLENQSYLKYIYTLSYIFQTSAAKNPRSYD